MADRPRQPQLFDGQRPTCTFCRIIRGEIACNRLFEDETSLVFLDHRPVFPGHCLVVPKEHCETLADLTALLIGPIFLTARLLSRAVEQGLGAEGSFVAINNKVSQSVPHLHIHVIPRRKGDGLKGFFWPRCPYPDAEALIRTQQSLQAAIGQLLSAGGIGSDR